MRSRSIYPLLLGLSCLSCPIHAKWKVEPDLSAQELYTSNIDLRPRDERESEWVVEVAPMLRIDNQSKKNPISGYYRAQGLHYKRASRQDKVYHQGLVKLEKHLVHDRLNFSLIGDHSQNVLFPSNQVSLDNIRGANTVNVSRFLLGPEIKNNLGKRFESRARYQFGYVNYHQDVPNAVTHDADIDIHTRQASRWTLGLNAHWDTTRQDSRELAEQFDGLVTAGYYVTQRFRPYIAWGYEDHTNQRGFSDLDGSRWHAGIFYAPSKRWTIDGYYGRRTFGNTYYFNSTWYKKHSSWTASYSEEITNFFRTQLMMLPTLQVNNLGLVTIQFQPQVREDVFVRKLASITWQGQTYKTYTRIQPYYEKREVEQTASEERGLGVNAEFGWLKSHKFNMSLIGGYAHQKLINRVTDERYQAGIRMNHNITLKTELSYGYSHFELNRSNEPSIRENTVFVSIYYRPVRK